MKIFFVKGQNGYDEEDPIIVLADTKKEAEILVQQEENKFSKKIFENNSPDEVGRAGKGYKIKKGVIWKQFNAG